MLSSTAVRNQMYIHTYDFTYKRIGVYVWLILASIGLVIMYIKLRQNRSNWYLIKSNVAVWFSVLVFSACFNWDKIITQYNIDNKPYAQIDFSYLFSLSEANIPQLIKLLSDKDFKVLLQKEKRLNHQLKTELKHRNQYSRSRYEQLENELNGFHHLWYEGQAFEEALHNKIANYLKEYKSDWRSYDLRDREIVNCIINR
jgi:hypothetical protein